ncbi:MAG: Lrp/AsnC ligand binding domain-containing protein, partial [Planctomycetaceae bacterium]
MVEAFILIQTDVGTAASVAQEVRGIAGVAEAADVTGPFDVIARVAAESLEELSRLVDTLGAVEGTTRT